MDLVADIMNQVTTGDNLARISSAAGGDAGAVKAALGMGLPAIVGSMAATAQAPGGADMLAGMLASAGGSGTAPSSGMAGTILGSHMGTIQNAIAQKTGLPPAVVGKVLEIAVPKVLEYVGTVAAGQNMDSAGLSAFLGDQAKKAMLTSPDAAALAGQLAGGQGGSAVSGLLKNVFGR